MILCSSSLVHAEGENGPMIGAAAIATRAAHETEVGGVQLELALWRDRLGIAIEGSHQTGLDGDGPRVTTLGGSLRLLLYRQLTPSLIDPQADCEFGIELHTILERAWWDDDLGRGPTSYGSGLVLRLRGDTDFTNVMAESRLFVRVLASLPSSGGDRGLARMMVPGAEREISVVVGLGAVFGSGKPAYVTRFRH